MQTTTIGNNTTDNTCLAHPARGSDLRPHRRWTTLAIVLLTGVGLVGATAPATAQPEQDHGRIVVRDSAEGLKLSRDVAHAGKVTITVEAPNIDYGGAIMFKLVPPATLATFHADFKDEVSGYRTGDLARAAKGTRNLTRHVRFYGLAEVARGRSISITQMLSPGTYFLVDDNADFAGGTPPLLPLTVLGNSRDHEAQQSSHLPTVSMTGDDRFDVPQPLPARGTISVRNVSDTLHFIQMWPVVPGTKDAAVQAWLDAGALGDPGFFVDGPTQGLNILSPGQSVQMTYDMPAGSYLLLCEIADAETGMEHVFMGMHKVVTLTPNRGSSSVGTTPSPRL
jgi:hypothetical protein